MAASGGRREKRVVGTWVASGTVTPGEAGSGVRRSRSGVSREVGTGRVLSQAASFSASYTARGGEKGPGSLSTALGK